MASPGEQFGLPLPGGIGVSHVKVYDSEGPDGLRGGTPHLHTVCSEAYLVINGEGLVQTLSSEGYGETPLSRGTVAWFSPGTVHRLVNLDGRLELFVLMSNAGLPEAGDMVIAFEPQMLADLAAYRSAATLPPENTTTAGSDAAAMARRDLAVRGFGHWRESVERDGAGALADLHAAAARVVAGPATGWASIIEADPARELERSRSQVRVLAAGSDASPEVTNRLGRSTIRSRSLRVDTRRYGCCGTLGTLVD